MRSIYLWVITILFAVPAFADTATGYGAYGSSVESVPGISLAEALKLALNANPDIIVASRELEAIQGVRTQADLLPNPTISTELEAAQGAAQRTLLLLNQPFELGNKRAARVHAADARHEAALAAIAAKQAEIRANVGAAFYEVLAAQERLRLAKAALAIATQARDAAAKRVEAGKISPVEETKSRVAESAVKIDVYQATNQLTAARKRLSALWGNGTPRFGDALGNITDLPQLPAEHDLSSLLEHAPAIKLAKLEVESRDAIASVERTKRTPNLTVSLGAQRNEEFKMNQAVVGLSVPIPVFDRNQGNLQEAISRTDKARDELVALRVQLDAQLTSQYERLRSALQSVDTFQFDILPGAQSAFEAASSGFQFGKFSYLEVLDAQRTLFQAQNQHLNALLEAHQAHADIERMLGEAMPDQKSKP